MTSLQKRKKALYDARYFQRNKKKAQRRRRQRYVQNRTEILQESQIYNRKHAEQKKRYDRRYYRKRRQRVKAQQQKYHAKHQVQRSQYGKKYFQENKSRRYAYVRNRLKIDVRFRLAAMLRSRVSRILKKGKKPGSAVKDLGCTLSVLRKHLERQFRVGMSWSNYGKGSGKGHVDHRKALATFDLTKRSQFLKAVNYKNLQPPWEIENLRKGKR